MAQSVQHLSSEAGTRPDSRTWPGASAQRDSVPVVRPRGWSAVALLAIALAIALLLWAGVWMGASDIVPGTRLATLARIVSFGLVAAAALEIAFAYGAWGVRPWAWRLGVALGLVTIVLTLLGAGRASQGAHLLTLVVEAGTVWYLLSPNVRELFDANGRRTGD
jgi:hypothetical protein